MPVVKRCLPSGLYRDLPVLEIDDWRELSAGFLEQAIKSLCAARFDFSPLYLEYWRKMIGAEGHSGLPPMTLAEPLGVL